MRSWLIVGAPKEEGCDHMTDQVLGSKLNNIEVAISKVLSIGKKCGKHSIGVCSREREDKRPVQEPRCLVQHTHGTLSKSLSDHLLDLANSGELGRLTRLLKLDLTGKKAPENLRDEFVVSVGLCSEDLLQDEEIVMSIY